MHSCVPRASPAQVSGGFQSPHAPLQAALMNNAACWGPPPPLGYSTLSVPVKKSRNDQRRGNVKSITVERLVPILIACGGRGGGGRLTSQILVPFEKAHVAGNPKRRQANKITASFRNNKLEKFASRTPFRERKGRRESGTQTSAQLGGCRHPEANKSVRWTRTHRILPTPARCPRPTGPGPGRHEPGAGVIVGVQPRDPASPPAPPPPLTLALFVGLSREGSSSPRAWTRLPGASHG